MREKVLMDNLGGNGIKKIKILQIIEKTANF